MKAPFKKWLFVCSVGLAVVLPTFPRVFSKLAAWRNPAGGTIEIRYYEVLQDPTELSSSGGWVEMKWKLTCPGQVRMIEEFKRPKRPGENEFASLLQNSLTHLGYDFPDGCFAIISAHKGGLWEVAHYPTVLNRMEKEFELELVSRHPSSDIIDMGPEFQRTFNEVSRIKFQRRSGGLSSEVTAWEEVREFFELLDFYPKIKGASTYPARDGCLDGVVHCHTYIDDDEFEEIEIYLRSPALGTEVGWIRQGKGLQLTAKSSQTLESYLAKLEYLPDGLDGSPSVINKRPFPAIKIIPPPAAIGKDTPAGVDPSAEKSAGKWGRAGSR